MRNPLIRDRHAKQSLIFDGLGYIRNYNAVPSELHDRRDGILAEDPNDKRHLIVEMRAGNGLDALLFAAHVACDQMLRTTVTNVSLRLDGGQTVATISKEDHDQTQEIDLNSPDWDRFQALFRPDEVVVLGEGRWTNNMYQVSKAGALALAILDRELA